MPGYLDNVNITIDNGSTPWEIVLGGAAESDMAQLPQFVTVACTFFPIMDILPRRENKTNPRVPLIVNGDNGFLSSVIDEATVAPNGQVSQASQTQFQFPPPVSTKPKRTATVEVGTSQIPQSPFVPGTSGFFDPITGEITP